MDAIVVAHAARLASPPVRLSEYAAPTGAMLVELTAALYRALHDVGTYRSPPSF
jgi:hypothetical protein